MLEESGSTFFYSTKTGEQDLTLHHGQRIDGALDGEVMLAFCKEQHIRMIIDAAHPFASRLHETIAQVSADLQIPVVRYERIYFKGTVRLIEGEDHSFTRDTQGAALAVAEFFKKELSK